MHSFSDDILIRTLVFLFPFFTPFLLSLAQCFIYTVFLPYLHHFSLFRPSRHTISFQPFSFCYLWPSLCRIVEYHKMEDQAQQSFLCHWKAQSHPRSFSNPLLLLGEIYHLSERERAAEWNIRVVLHSTSNPTVAPSSISGILLFPPDLFIWQFSSLTGDSLLVLQHWIRKKKVELFLCATCCIPLPISILSPFE